MDLSMVRFSRCSKEWYTLSSKMQIHLSDNFRSPWHEPSVKVCITDSVISLSLMLLVLLKKLREREPSSTLSENFNENPVVFINFNSIQESQEVSQLHLAHTPLGLFVCESQIATMALADSLLLVGDFKRKITVFTSPKRVTAIRADLCVHQHTNHQ